MNLYAEIFECVFDNGRIACNPEEDYQCFLSEVETEVEFEASERGLSKEECKACVEFALSAIMFLSVVVMNVKDF